MEYAERAHGANQPGIDNLIVHWVTFWIGSTS
jgi:hypothetical protein